MSDNTENNTPKKVKVAPIVDHGEHDLVTYVGAKRGADTRYGIVFPIPQNDEDAKARYNSSLGDLVRMGVQKIATSPNFVEMFENGTLKEGGHALGQKLADDYKVGVRAAGGGITAAEAKKKATAAEAVAIEMAARVGLSIEDVHDMIAKAQADAEAPKEDAPVDADADPDLEGEMD